jgi:hypothetical protein
MGAGDGQAARVAHGSLRQFYVCMQYKENGLLNDTAWRVAIDMKPNGQDADDISTVVWHYPFATVIYNAKARVGRVLDDLTSGGPRQ